MECYIRILSLFRMSNKLFKTRMHSGRMRTARSFTVCRSHSICSGGGHAWHAPCHACPPCYACPPVDRQTAVKTSAWGGMHMPPAMHAPPTRHAPSPPPAMHAPLPCLPPLPCMLPLPRTSPLPCMPHPCGLTDSCKNITFANFVCGR